MNNTDNNNEGSQGTSQNLAIADESSAYGREVKAHFELDCALVDHDIPLNSKTSERLHALISELYAFLSGKGAR